MSISVLYRNQLIELVIRLGRIAMDFGLAAFLEKFEEYFGRVATRFLLFIIGVGIVVTMARLIKAGTESLMMPLLNSLFSTDDINTNIALFILLGITTISATVCLYCIMSNVMLRKAYKYKISRASAVLEQAESASKSVQDVNAANRLLLEEIIKSGVSSGKISQEQVGLIRSLLDTGVETPP